MKNTLLEGLRAARFAVFVVPFIVSGCLVVLFGSLCIGIEDFFDMIESVFSETN